MNNTVIKAFEILKLVSQNKSGLTLAQITRSLNLSKSTAFNIVHTLTDVGLLTMEEGQLPVYRMGIESLKLGLAYLRETSLDTAARPVLSRLCRDVQETVFMAVRCGMTDLVYIMKFISDSEFQTVYSVGDVRPMLSLGMGKAMLSAMTDEEIRSIITPEHFSFSNQPSISDMNSLLEYIHNTRNIGYAIDDTSENIYFAGTVAAPVLDIDNHLAGAISIVFIRDPRNIDRVQLLGQKVSQAALEISQGLGYMHSSLYST